MSKENPIRTMMEFHNYSEEVLNEWDSKFENKLQKPVADIEVFGYIEDGLVKQVTEVLNKAGGKEVKVRINSPGGQYFSGVAVANLLREYDGKVTTYNYGIAASCAGNIFLAGDERVMFKDARLMIHNVWGFTSGDAKKHRLTAERLESNNQTLINEFYNEVLDIDEDELKDLMENEKLINFDDCMKYHAATKMGSFKNQLNPDEDPPKDVEVVESTSTGGDVKSPEEDNEEMEKNWIEISNLLKSEATKLNYLRRKYNV